MNKCENCNHREVCKYREEYENATIVVPIEFLEYNCKYFQKEETVYYRDICVKPLFDHDSFKCPTIT